jgi:hypothetical protein
MNELELENQKLKARNILLEQCCVQCHHTISFLHQCLLNPTYYKYAHPNQTKDRLDAIEKLVKIPKGCAHSMHRPSCPDCMEHIEREKLRNWANSVLNHNYET